MYQSNIDELKNNPDYVYLGNHRFMHKDVHEKALKEFLDKYENVTFIGEMEHPQSENIKEDYDE